MLHILLLASWVLVANPQGIKTPTSTIKMGAPCLITSFQHLTDQGPLDGAYHLYRLMYTPSIAGEITCPPGTLFLATPAMVEQWQAEERAQSWAILQHREAIRAILKRGPGALDN